MIINLCFKVPLITILLLLPDFLMAQLKITEKVVQESNKPVEMAEIQLLTKDSIVIKSELSDEDDS